MAHSSLWSAATQAVQEEAGGQQLEVTQQKKRKSIVQLSKAEVL